MIAFDLQCSKGHVFEGWFEDNNAYEEQNKEDLISCPLCEDKAIVKLPSTFAIKGTQANKYPLDEKRALTEFTKQISDYINKNFDNVGTDFAKEALKIHYGASEPRNIRGVSTKKEEKLLKEEGVEFIKFPIAQAPDSDSDSDSDPDPE